jgi:hypothetical protein
LCVQSYRDKKVVGVFVRFLEKKILTVKLRSKTLWTAIITK